MTRACHKLNWWLVWIRWWRMRVCASLRVILCPANSAAIEAWRVLWYLGAHYRAEPYSPSGSLFQVAQLSKKGGVWKISWFNQADLWILPSVLTCIRIVLDITFCSFSSFSAYPLHFILLPSWRLHLSRMALRSLESVRKCWTSFSTYSLFFACRPTSRLQTDQRIVVLWKA